MNAVTAAPEPRWDEEYDLIVLGAGAGGMTAALAGAIAGLRTLLIEKTDKVGGTTARSGGAVWIPNNPQQAARGIDADAAPALAYLDALVGERADRSLRAAFVAQGPRMLEELDAHSDVGFQLAPDEADYRQDVPGAAAGGRCLRPLEFDGRTLGPDFERVAAPLRELMVFGGMMVTRGEVSRLLTIGTSWSSFLFAAKLCARYLADRMRYSRGTRLVLGSALVARLFSSLANRNVPIWFESVTQQLILDGGEVAGVAVVRDGVVRRLRARAGVVLAGGGFPASPSLRARYLPQPVATETPAYDGCTGDLLLLAEHAGGTVATGADNAYWFPSSFAKRRDGSTAVFPHIVLDRAKPGLIAVNAAGARFVDEASPYHEFVRAMYRSNAGVPTIPALLVCDRLFLWKYGLGVIHPHTLGLGRFIRSGYLYSGRTLKELAERAGVDSHGLEESVARHNAFARSGVDADFGKGGNAYDRSNGDAAHGPNPCLGPIGTSPYFAVAVFPTPLATSAGLKANAHAQVVDRSGNPIAGLYVCGNDMESPMGGEYPGPGAQIGVAMTFGYIAATHAAGRLRADVRVARRGR